MHTTRKNKRWILCARSFKHTKWILKSSLIIIFSTFASNNPFLLARHRARFFPAVLSSSKSIQMAKLQNWLRLMAVDSPMMAWKASAIDNRGAELTRDICRARTSPASRISNTFPRKLIWMCICVYRFLKFSCILHNFFLLSSMRKYTIAEAGARGECFSVSRRALGHLYTEKK